MYYRLNIFILEYCISLYWRLYLRWLLSSTLYTWSYLDCGSMFFNFRRDEGAFLILLLRFLYCSFHVRFSSTLIPRYLTFWARVISSPFMFTSSGSTIRLVCRLWPTTVYSVLSVFKLSLFWRNHSVMLSTSF